MKARNLDINDIDTDSLSPRERAALSAYTGKMFVSRFRDLQDYAEELFHTPVPMTSYVSSDFMAEFSRRAKDDVEKISHLS